jgi:hypothetical protein
MIRFEFKKVGGIGLESASCPGERGSEDLSHRGLRPNCFAGVPNYCWCPRDQPVYEYWFLLKLLLPHGSHPLARPAGMIVYTHSIYIFDDRRS